MLADEPFAKISRIFETWALVNNNNDNNTNNNNSNKK